MNYSMIKIVEVFDKFFVEIISGILEFIISFNKFFFTSNFVSKN